MWRLMLGTVVWNSSAISAWVSQTFSFSKRHWMRVFPKRISALRLSPVVRCALTADEHDVELNGFLGLRFRRRHGHLGLERMSIYERKLRPEHRLGQGRPPLRP